MTTQQERAELRKLAEDAKNWRNSLTEIHPATEDDPCTMGATDDGEFYQLVTIHCEDYERDSMPLAAYIAAANPAAVIGLLDEIDRLRTEAVAADIEAGNLVAGDSVLVIAGLTAERDAVPCVVLTPEERAAFERFHETWEDNEGYDVPKEMMRRLAEVGVVHHITAGRYDITKFGHYVLAAGAAPVPEDWRSAVAMAYGHLWHINNEPMDPIPLRSEESASYAARKLLRDLLTTKERGEAINTVGAMLAAALKEQA